nr:hypothetical protein [Tanacetum cinerariifolium]
MKVLDNSVANPLYSLRDEDLLKSKDPQVVVVAAKLPILNPNEFDMWKMRIEQYFLMIDYSLWEVILNGDSPTPTRIVDGVVQVIAPTTTKQRLAKKNELKARGTLLMALPNKHQLKFNIHKDVKSLMEAIEKSRLEIRGETISQEDINLKFLRSLPSEWKTHTLIWRNKADLEEQSLDDLFNNLKIYEAEVKGSFTFSQNTQNIAFVSFNNTDSTNESVNVVPSVSAASSKAPVSTLPDVNSLNDDVIYSFFASQSNSPQLDNEDLKQIDDADLEEIDLKWQMAMFTMRARRFLQKTGRNLDANGTAAIGFDMSKVECYNCHRRGHFARECRSPRDNRYKEASRKTVPVEVSTLNALVSQCDAVGEYDWSFQADKEPTNYALMAYASSGSSSSSGSDNEVALCSKACSKAYATLQPHYDKLTVDFRKSQFDVLSYKTESQISDKTGLGYDSQVFDRQVFDCEELHSYELDDSVPTSPENDRYQIGKGYHVVPPPHTGTFMPSKPDLVFNNVPNGSETVTNVVDVESNETEIEYVPKQKEPTFVLTSKHVKTPRTSVKEVEHPKQAENLRTVNQKSRGHKNSCHRKACFVCKSLNHLIKDCDYYEKQMVQKPVWNKAMNVNHQNSARMTHPHSNRNVVPKAVLTRSRLVSLNAARPVSTVVHQTTVKSSRPVKHVTTVKVNKVNDIQGIKGNVEKALANWGNPQQALKDKCVIDSGCSRHMTGKISFLSEFEEINEGYVAFGRNPKGGKITGKVLIKAQQHISNESPLLGVNTPRCDEDSIELMELMVFMASATIKKVNDDVPLRALIYGKKVVVIEDVIRQDLRLNDADGVECLPNEEIFTELASMGYEKPPPKLTFYKAFFSAQVGKCFSGVETPLFASMLVQPRPQAAEEKAKVKVPIAPTLPSLTNALSPVPQDPTPTPYASPSSPTQEQPTETSESSIPLLNTLLETCATLSQKGRIDQDVSTATKDVSAAEPTVFDDKEVTMTMAQTLIKMKEKKAKLLDE